MSEQEKKQHRIYDMLHAATKRKTFFEIIRVSLWPPKSPNLNPLDYTICGVLETSQILVHLRQLLRRNGIKCLKNLF